MQLAELKEMPHVTVEQVLVMRCAMVARIVGLEKALQEILELPSVRQDECDCIAMAAMDE